MVPEERFGRWVAIGVPLFLIGGIVGSIVIHLGAGISWVDIFLPAALFVGLQIGSYLCAFWAGKLARKQGITWPMALLSGFYLWGSGLLIIHYGTEWKLLPPIGDAVSFSLCMVLVTVVTIILFALAKDKIRDLYC